MHEIALGLIGHPVEHSLSPAMHKAAFKLFSLNGTYHLFDIRPENLNSELNLLIKNGISGFNITVPHKETILKANINLDKQVNKNNFFDYLSPEAILAKAVNTVRIDSNQKIHGHNTDIGGFREALNNFFSINSCPINLQKDLVIILGSGGAARAILIALKIMGWQNIVILNRNFEKADFLLKDISSRLEFSDKEIIFELSEIDSQKFYSYITEKLNSYSLIINCTSLETLQNNDSPLPEWTDKLFKLIKEHSNNSFCDKNIFFDTFYKKSAQKTKMSQKAESYGFHSIDGLEMLAAQARLAFEFWTGHKPEFNFMKEAALNFCPKS